MANMNGIKSNWTTYFTIKIKGSEIKWVINAKLLIGKRCKKKKKVDWEKSIKEAKLCMAL